MSEYVQQDIFNNTELDRRLDALEAKADLGIKRGDNIRRGFFARLNDEKKLRQEQEEMIKNLNDELDKIKAFLYSHDLAKSA